MECGASPWLHSAEDERNEGRQTENTASMEMQKMSEFLHSACLCGQYLREKPVIDLWTNKHCAQKPMAGMPGRFPLPHHLT